MRHVKVYVVSALAIAALSSGAQADYTLTPLSGGLSSVSAAPGSTITVDVALTSTGSDVHNSSIFRVVFSEPGLEFLSYTWGSPYETGTIFDASQPGLGSLPMVLSASALEGAGYPSGVVDVEMSNVTPSGTFSSGVLVSLTLRVPSVWTGSDVVDISIAPDTLANGFDVVPSVGGQTLHLNIPTPATSALALGGLAMVVRSRTRSRKR